MFSFLKASPPPPRKSGEIDAEYKKLRWQVFAGVFIDYVAYYLICKNFSLAMPYLIQEYGFSKADLGTVGVALSLAYGISKFVMGNVSDRSNPKYFITIGLLGSAIVSLIFGLVPGVLASIPVMIVLAALNGWFQGMGYPPGAKTMTNWFSKSERGSWWSWWNVSHNLGGGLIGPLAILGLAIFGTCQSLFYLPALIAILLALVMFWLMRDTPESQGLPQVDEWRGEKVLEKVESADTLSAMDIFRKYIINNKFLWAIAIANVFVYFIRYGIIDWAPPMLMFLAGVLIAIVVYWKNPAGNPLIDNICLVAIGFLIYGPVMMIGLQAADLVPRVATGTAIGLTGLFGYLLGSASAGWVMGKLVDLYGWDGGFDALIASSFLAFGFIAITLFNKKSAE
ncbi:glycerol-3-phosphate transporter [Actinobacillus ureae]|uniref:MFS transporter n=1 Tax=Actinobacillus ureae TaxID=723 RepID=UPI000E16F723|nr:MFS transporter [Actinobacillus ureae]SUT86812.1 glycerol-3-phosphate transporter [Actinobacillus ureae]SUU47117.1 glycerol-3-phosphate transporter [Actinobacillus ureae]